MKLTVLGSSSAGNGYVIQDKDEALIIEAGMNLQKVKQALDYDITKVSGCIITHSHGDHSKHAARYDKVFDIYTLKDVIEVRKLKNAREIFPEKGFRVGNFRVFPFPVAHDVPTVGFLINHRKFGNLLFLTDSFLCEYSFKGLNHILIEANYVDDVLEENLRNGLHYSVRDRVMTSHMEIQTTREVLLRQPLDDVYNIVLIHLSENNSDPELMYEIIAKATGKPVSIALPGLEVQLSQSPY